MDIPQERKDAALLEALEELERLEDFHHEIITGTHYLIRRDKVVINPYTGLPVLDHRPAEKAEKELAAIAKQRDRLLGIKTVEHPGDSA